MRLLLISNSTQPGKGYLDHCAPDIKRFLGKLKQVVFVPYALHDWDAYTARARERFSQMGFVVKGIHEDNGPFENLNEADALFVGGGNTFRLLNQLYEQHLVEPFKHKINGGLPYIGASAGVNIVCPTIKTTNDMPIVYPPSFNALGLIPLQLNPHYIDASAKSMNMGETRERRIAEFLETNEIPVLGLQEGAILLVEGEKATLNGKRGAKLFRKHHDPEVYKKGANLNFLLRAE